MMQLTDLQRILADYLFDGAGDIVGIILFGIALYFLLMVTKDTVAIIVLLIPIMLIFAILGLISTTAMFIMIIIMVILIALNVSGALFGGA